MNVKKTETKVWLKMLGNVRKYESGQQIEVSEAEAVELLSLGYAVKVDAPIQAEELYRDWETKVC